MGIRPDLRPLKFTHPFRVPLSEAKDSGGEYLLFSNLHAAAASAVNYRTRVEELKVVEGKVAVVDVYDVHECAKIANPKLRLANSAAVVG